jgi:hypothetical protein
MMPDNKILTLPRFYDDIHLVIFNVMSGGGVSLFRTKLTKDTKDTKELLENGDKLEKGSF